MFIPSRLTAQLDPLGETNMIGITLSIRRARVAPIERRYQMNYRKLLNDLLWALAAGIVIELLRLAILR